MLVRQRLIRDIDYSITEDDILGYAISDVGIAKVRRLNSFKNGQKSLSSLVCLTFKGQTLPNEGKILGVICKVEPFIQKVTVRQVFEFGHMSDRCLFASRCKHCGGGVHQEDCNSKSCCIHCGGEHCSTDPSCPEFLVQKNIKEMMALCNISFLEAKNNLKNNSNYANRVSQEINARINVSSKLEFPNLVSSSNQLSMLTPSSSLPRLKFSFKCY